MAEQKAIDKEYLLTQLQNFAKVIGSNFVAQDSDTVAQIATNTSDIATLKTSGTGVNESAVNTLIDAKIKTLVNNADEKYDTLGEISKWIIDNTDVINGKATSFEYDPDTKDLTLYAGDTILSNTTIDVQASGTTSTFIPPSFNMNFTTGHIQMTGGRGVNFKVNGTDGHLYEGEEDELNAE